MEMQCTSNNQGMIILRSTTAQIILIGKMLICRLFFIADHSNIKGYITYPRKPTKQERKMSGSVKPYMTHSYKSEPLKITMKKWKFLRSLIPQTHAAGQLQS